VSVYETSVDLSGPCPGLAITVMTLLPSLDEILRPPKFGLFLLLPSTKDVVRGREELMVVVARRGRGAARR
jgi:hypothetical protein